MHSLAATVLLLALAAAEAGAQLVPAGVETQIHVYTAEAQSRPRVARASGGEFLVVWESDGQDGSGSGVFGRRWSADGVPLGGEFRVNARTADDQLLPAVAAAGDGFVVLWTGAGQDGHATGVAGQRYAAGGAPVGGEFQVNGYTTGYQFGPAVAADAAGNFVAVWESDGQDGDGRGIVGRRWAASGAPLGGEFPVNTYTTGDQFAPDVAVDGAGAFVVAWTGAGQDGSGYGVFARRFASDGAGAGGEFRVNASTLGDQFGPSVGADAAGNFVVTWTASGQDGSGYAAIGRRFDATGAPRGGELRLNAHTLGDQMEPVVRVHGTGSFLVAWTSAFQDGSGYGVFARRWDAAGVPTSAELRVNTTTAGDQFGPSVAADGAGHPVVAWQSDGQDGSDGGVFAQRYLDTAATTTTSTTSTTTASTSTSSSTATTTSAPTTSAPSSSASTSSTSSSTTSTPGSTSTTTSSPPPDGARPVAGSRLVLVDPGVAARRKVVLVVDDAALDVTPGTGVDPVRDGAALAIGGAGGASACLELPSAAWSVGATRAGPAFRYLDRRGAHGPCTVALLKHRARLKVVCSGRAAPLALSLGAPAQGRVGVGFRSGGTAYCAEFGGVVTRDAPGRFTARAAPPPAACPPLPPCPEDGAG